MRFLGDKLLHSASDLNTFLGCRHATTLNLQKLRDPASLPERALDDEATVLIQDAGHAHEQDYLDRLKSAGEVAEIASDGPLEQRVAATVAAMQAGSPIIYQAAFLDAPWHGFADFLRRVERPSALGEHSYEVIDTKLARRASPKHVLQLALYSELIGKVQGEAPHEMHLVLGDHSEVSFRRVEFEHTLRAATSRYLGAVADDEQTTAPEPCSACGYCGWRELCAQRWEEEDHLSRVAGMQSSQIGKLKAAGITTVAALAQVAPGTSIPKLAPETFERLRAQATLQVARLGGEPSVELLPAAPGRGFTKLPEPSPYDLFFDLEGDPLCPDGLEYLWGVHLRDAANGEPLFRYEWAHDRDAERAAFETMVDFFTDHVARYPAANIYHYASYEVTVLRRLSTRFASREHAVDELLRAEKFVDLFGIVRAAIRTSEPNLSLKTLEVFFAEKRGDEVTKADQSIVHYHRWRETGDQTLLDGILKYNQVDCENTEGLRDWLTSLRPNVPWWTKPSVFSGEDRAPERTEAEERREKLRKSVREDAACLSPRGRELAAYLLDFHGRARKPDQWAVFDRCERDEEELIDDGECIGGILPAGSNWQRPDKQSIIATYRFPEQDTKLKNGATVLHSPTRARLGTIAGIDLGRGLVEIKRGVRSGTEWPTSGSVIPGWPLDDAVLEAAVERVIRRWASTAASGSTNGTAPYQALIDLIERTPPRLADWSGGPLVQTGESLIDAATSRALALDHSSLFIQGPPGTGKTYTSAHMILSLIKAGKRVGVSSNSHKAINNLLATVEEAAKNENYRFSGAKKVTQSDPETYLKGSMIQDVADAKDIEGGGFRLVGGTAWLFAREALNQRFDYLIVDEAGQVSLGHLLAMGSAAKNIILVGDQMQLSQPIKGAHPGESGLSALDFLLEGAATIAPDRGILLDTSWRMHPSIGGFISAAVYDGRLTSHPDCANQKLVLDGAAPKEAGPSGIRMIEMTHEGCRQSSDEEVAKVLELVEGLLGQGFIDRDNCEGVIGLENILVVSPFNMQVNALKAALPAGARVGTVDKFQGQEAEIVIVSMATSSPEDLPRNVDFFYSKNRLNVAISRARTLAIVLANPRLLELEATMVEHLRLVNTLAWLQAEAAV